MNWKHSIKGEHTTALNRSSYSIQRKVNYTLSSRSPPLSFSFSFYCCQFWAQRSNLCAHMEKLAMMMIAECIKSTVYLCLSVCDCRVKCRNDTYHINVLLLFRVRFFIFCFNKKKSVWIALNWSLFPIKSKKLSCCCSSSCSSSSHHYYCWCTITFSLSLVLVRSCWLHLSLSSSLPLFDSLVSLIVMD